MVLPCKLVGLSSTSRTKELVEAGEKSCIYWKYEMPVVLKP